MKQITKNIMLVCFLLSFVLAACEARIFCAFQSVAGDSQACQEAQNK